MEKNNPYIEPSKEFQLVASNEVSPEGIIKISDIDWKRFEQYFLGQNSQTKFSYDLQGMRGNSYVDTKKQDGLIAEHGRPGISVEMIGLRQGDTSKINSPEDINAFQLSICIPAHIASDQFLYPDEFSYGAIRINRTFCMDNDLGTQDYYLARAKMALIHEEIVKYIEGKNSLSQLQQWLMLIVEFVRDMEDYDDLVGGQNPKLLT